MIRVTFICLGNICRSPMAEAIMRDLVEKANLTAQVKVDSVGTGSWHVGEPPHKGTRQKLQEHHISTAGMKARQLAASDYRESDYLVCMDASNEQHAREMLRQYDDPKVFRFLDITPHKKDVPDPWYTGDFEETYQLCLQGCEALLTKIKDEHSI